MIFRICIAFSILLFSSTLYAAGSCKSALNQINADITRYSTRISTKQLPWMQFAWLKQHFGVPKIEKISETQTQYTWKCSKQDQFVALIDKNGNLTNVRSDYSAASGAVELSACISACTDQQITPKSSAPLSANDPLSTINTSMVQGPVANCVDVANQIKSLSENTHPVASSPYPFENIAWLESQFGKPKVQTLPKGEVSIWQCADNINSILYLVARDGSAIITSVSCPANKCLIATLVRNGNIQKGRLLQMTKNDI